MKIRLFDKFDVDFTCGRYADVEFYTDSEIYFSDGDVMKIDSQYCGIEEEEEAEKDI